MREPIFDHGSAFGAHRVHENGNWDGDFKQHLEKYGIKPILIGIKPILIGIKPILIGIKPILIGVKHPQTNGKLERFFGEYKRHRHAFSSFEEFIEWYNDRPHGSLEFERFETPEKAFRRKMPQEAYYRDYLDQPVSFRIANQCARILSLQRPRSSSAL